MGVSAYIRVPEVRASHQTCPVSLVSQSPFDATLKSTVFFYVIICFGSPFGPSDSWPPVSPLPHHHLPLRPMLNRPPSSSSSMAPPPPPKDNSPQKPTNLDTVEKYSRLKKKYFELKDVSNLSLFPHSVIPSAFPSFHHLL